MVSSDGDGVCPWAGLRRAHSRWCKEGSGRGHCLQNCPELSPTSVWLLLSAAHGAVKAVENSTALKMGVVS